MHTLTLQIHRMQLTARRLFTFERASWRGTLALMIAAWLVPFLVHLIPWEGPRPLGLHLLPAFWTAFVAVYAYGFGLGVLVALVVPAVNYFTTGLPLLDRVGLMSVELVAFAGFSALLMHRWPALRFAAPLAWVSARALAIAVQWALPGFAYGRNPVEHWLDSVGSSLAGLGVLFALNLVLVRLLPKDRDWEAE